MNDVPRQKLLQVVARHGREVVDNPRRCEGLLRDYCGSYRREIAVLISALEERVAADLLSPGKGTPRASLLRRLAQRLEDNVAMEKGAARWAVHSWALALGVVLQAELDAIEERSVESTPQALAAPLADETKPARRSRNISPDIVISPHGDGDFTSVNEALKMATHGARLLVRPGLYREGFVLDKKVEILGDGKREEIIIAGTEASCILMGTDEAKVSGLTLREEAGSSEAGDGFFAVDVPRGRLTLDDCDITSNSLSCVGVHNKLTDVHIRRCRIHTGSDSGVYLFDEARARLEDCDIDSHRNVGVAITRGASIIISRCQVHHGSDAGIVAWDGGGGSVEGCEIFGNVKAGVGISEQGNLTVDDCRIYSGDNSGIFVHDHGRVLLTGCNIYGHREPEVAVTTGGDLIIRGCEIHAGAVDGVFISGGGKALVERCEIYGNADAGVKILTDGRAVIRQSRITRNGRVAIKVDEGAEALVEDSDLRGNLISAWESGPGALVKGRGNKY
jgi:nitrous oxidase accessory protein NosD